MIVTSRNVTFDETEILSGYPEDSNYDSLPANFNSLAYENAPLV